MTSPTLELRGPDGQRFGFDPGAVSLGFVDTGGPGDLAAFEILRDPQALHGWLEDVLEIAVVRVTRQDHAAALALREAIRRAALARVHGRPGPASAVRAINAAATASPPTPRLTPDGTITWERVRPASALSLLARDAIGVLAGGAPIRVCDAADCSLIFADTSRPSRRRWCSMDRCGNRAKVRAFRGRTGTTSRREEER